MRHILYLVLLGLCLRAEAFTTSTTARMASEDIKHAIEKYAKANGRLPSNLTELDQFILKDEQKNDPSIQDRSFLFQSIDKIVNGKVEDAFQLIPPSTVEMVPQKLNATGSIIAVTASPIIEDQGNRKGRYVTWQNSQGHILVSWLDESVVAAQFSKAGIPLPSAPLWRNSSPNADPDYLLQRYVKENFKDPNNPTPAELERMKRDLQEKYGNKPSVPVAPDTQSAFRLNTLDQSVDRSTAQAVEPSVAKSHSFPVIPVAILAAVVVGAAVFFLRRNSP